jgi:adenylate cyclase class 2
MAVEIEIKMKVDHLAPVRDRLRAIGAKLIGEVMETNVFFDTPDRALLGSDCGLRLRRSRDCATKAEKLIATYKGPRGGGQVKKREEIEVAVDKQQPAEELFQRLGYVRQLSFEKRRETWRVAECLVELDELPQLGCFVEIEGPDEEAVLEVREALELEDRPLVKKSYIAMVDELLKSSGNTKLEFAS